MNPLENAVSGLNEDSNFVALLASRTVVADELYALGRVTVPPR